MTVESSRLFRPVWKVSNFQAIENKEIRSMGDTRISILEVLKNQILRRTFDCQVVIDRQIKFRGPVYYPAIAREAHNTWPLRA